MYTASLFEADGRPELGFKASAVSGLKKAGIPVTSGFVITPKALESFISVNGIRSKVRQFHENVDRSPSGLRKAEEGIKDLFLNSVIPGEARSAILASYGELSVSGDIRKAEAAFSFIKAGRDHALVAVRPSVVREEKDSFAGVLESFVNVSGEDDVLKHVKLCWASLFYPSTSMYTEGRGTGTLDMSVIVQKMAISEKSGTVATGFGGDKVLVEATWGLGKAASSGLVTPDEYLLDSGGRLIEKNISKKLWMLERNDMTGVTSKVHVPGSRMDAQVLSDAELRKLFELGRRVAGAFQGQQVMDWCIGRNRVIITDVKPGNCDITPVREEHPSGDILVTGRFVSRGTATGTVKTIGPSGGAFGPDDIVVMESSSIGNLISVKDASGVIVDEGGRMSNFGILAREMGIPAIAGTHKATSVLRLGERITMVTELGKVMAAQEPVNEPPEGAGLEGAMQDSYQPQHIQEDAYGSQGQEPPQPDEMPMPFIQEGANEQPTETETRAGAAVPGEVRLFVRAGPDLIGRVAQAEGYVIYNLQPDPSLMGGPAAQETRPVWASCTGESDFQWASGIARRANDAGNAESGVLVPVVRGRDDLEKFRYGVPAGAGLGLSIRTPAMLHSAESIIADGVGMVNIELGPLAQLYTGLQKPDQEIGESLLGMIGKAAEICAGKGITCCVTLGSHHLTDWNIESLLRKGVGTLCVDARSAENVRAALGRIRDKMSPAGGEEPGAGKDDDAPFPFDFSPPFSSS